MMLRPRQKLFVERSLRALDTHGNTLGVAPTGAGKTVMLSAAVGEHIGNGCAKAAVLAHRDELTAQNLAKFRRVNPGISTSVPPPPVVPVTRTGDLWRCGDHRLLCGDATKAEDVQRALGAGHLADMAFQDPPYNVAYVGGTSAKMTIANDALGIDGGTRHA